MSSAKKTLLPDTDVVVDLLRGRDEAVEWFKEHSGQIILSSIVVAELYAGVRDGDEIERLDNFVSLFRIASVTAGLARVGGLYKRDYGKSHGVGLGDAIIAATVQAENADLKTLNTKHYPMFKDIKAPYEKGN